MNDFMTSFNDWLLEQIKYKREWCLSSEKHRLWQNDSFFLHTVLPDQQISDQQLARETSPAAKSEEKRMFSQANQQWLENAIFRPQMF